MRFLICTVGPTAGYLTEHLLPSPSSSIFSSSRIWLSQIFNNDNKNNWISPSLCLTIFLEILFYHLHLHFGCNDDDGYHFNTLIVHLFVRFTTVKSLYLLINMMIIHLRRFNFMYNGEVAFPQSVISQVCTLFLSSIAVQYVYLSSKHFPYESISIAQEDQFEVESKNQLNTIKPAHR